MVPILAFPSPCSRWGGTFFCLCSAGSFLSLVLGLLVSNSGLLQCGVGHHGVPSPWSSRPSCVGAQCTLRFSCGGPECVGGRADSLEQRGSAFRSLQSWGVPEVQSWSWGRGSYSWFVEETLLLRSSSLHLFYLFSLLLPWMLSLLVATLPPALEAPVFLYILRIVIL